MHSQTIKTFAVLLFVLVHSTCSLASNRTPVVAGLFYPGTSEQIKHDISSFFNESKIKAEIDANADFFCIIVPHAGWIYSGKTAAIAFKTIKDIEFQDVVFIGVDHRSGRRTLSVWPRDGFQTPLGTTKIDAALSDRLLKSSDLIVDDEEQHRNEHSLEVLLPFFQYVFPKNDAVFVSCGGPVSNSHILAASLKKIIADLPGKTLLIVSSDWSHYHSAEEAEKLDQNAIDSVLALDSEKLLDDCRNQKAELCGLHGVVCAIELARAASATARLLARSDSSEAGGSSKNVVGYAAILFQGNKASLSEKSEHLKEKEKKSMSFEKEALTAVRKTLEAHLSGKPIPELKLTDAKFSEKRGIFVTLKKNEELRGCIGFIKGYEPLNKAIVEMAISAATKDPRFNPVVYEELKDIKIEVSILSPMQEVKDVSEIKIGRDGLFLQMGGRSGLLLPQVPVEWNWDLEEYLKHICLKAGLPPGSYKHPEARLQKFSADVFAEK